MDPMRPRSRISGWRVLVLLVLSLLAIFVVAEILHEDGPRRYDPPARRTKRPLESAFARLRRAEGQRLGARDDAFDCLLRACAEGRRPARALAGLLNELRKHFPPSSEEARACLRLEFGQCVRMLREGHEEEALSLIFHLGNPDGIAPDYDYVWFHLQSERYDEAAQVAAEAVAAREKANLPDLAAHLELYAWLLRRADRLDEARAVESRLAEDPPPPREPERKQQAADDTGPR
jgi:hypothetical protein